MILRAAVAVLLLATDAVAQTVPEVRGRITDVLGSPVGAAMVEAAQQNARAYSDAAGIYQLRLSGPCECIVTISRLGYQTRQTTVTVAAGVTRRLDAVLTLLPVPVDSVVATATAGAALDRAQIRRSAGASIADVLATLPAVVVTTSTPGGPQRVSIRGSSAAEVLVVVDDVPINDPVTGAADLSRIHKEQVETIRVLAGSQSARWGARALGGVVLITTRGAKLQHEVQLMAGTLGTFGAGATWGWQPGGHSIAAGARFDRSDNEFDFRLPASAGGQSGVRDNADAFAADVFLVSEHSLRGGALRTRVSGQQDERGLPGRGFAPSPEARQESKQLRAQLDWSGAASSLALTGTNQRMRYHDAVPPAGLPYDDTVALREVHARAATQRTFSRFALSGGMEARLLDVESETLTSAGTKARDLGAFALVRWSRDALFAQAAVRSDHSSLADRFYRSHALTIGLERAVRVQLTQRSSYAPPSLADQFFRESVGVEPNPDLRAERVRSEWEIAVERIAPKYSLRAAAYTADVDGMIIWAPDYRFVWSPRNVNVGRSGGELSAAARISLLAVSAWFAHARVTYDEIDDGAVQVVYRPRNTAVIALDADRANWQARIETRYTGERNTAPTDLNALPGFWSASASIGYTAATRRARINSSLRIERLLDEDDSLIFGFPQPGRTFALTIRFLPNHIAGPIQ